MTDIIELSVAPEEQTVGLLDGYTAEIRFDPFYYRWFYDLYKDNELLYSGISLTPDSCGLLHICVKALGLVDVGNKHETYEPFLSLGSRLVLIEVS